MRILASVTLYCQVTHDFRDQVAIIRLFFSFDAQVYILYQQVHNKRKDKEISEQETQRMTKGCVSVMLHLNMRMNVLPLITLVHTYALIDEFSITQQVQRKD